MFCLIIEMIFLTRVTNHWIKVTGQHFLKLKEVVKKKIIIVISTKTVAVPIVRIFP